MKNQYPEKSKIEEEDLKKSLCKILMKTAALKFGVFKLTSGKLSPYYIDLRIIPSFPEALQKIIMLYKHTISERGLLSTFNRIAGIPTSGIPYASIIAYELEKPFIYVREKRKTHGTGKSVEGILLPGDKVLVIDDLITTGESLVGTVDSIRKEGGVVSDAVVLIDRQERGFEKMDEIGVKLHSFIGIKEVAEILYSIGMIDEGKYEEILRKKL